MDEHVHTRDGDNDRRYIGQVIKDQLLNFFHSVKNAWVCSMSKYNDWASHIQLIEIECMHKVQVASAAYN